ncbi:MAG: hypothetical protein H6834_15805 [Planctomycetes bacterium]|nr:hypothetical protein [Planctomycetota bacterium]
MNSPARRFASLAVLLGLACVGFATFSLTNRPDPSTSLADRRAVLDQGVHAAEALTTQRERLAPRRRAVQIWERWNETLLATLARRPAVAPPVIVARKEAPPNDATPLPPAASLTAETTLGGAQVDVRLSWIVEKPPGFGAPVPRYDIWRWREPGGRPQRVATNVEGPAWNDPGLPGGHRVVYAVYAVTGDERFSRSTGSTVRVELPRSCDVLLVDPPLVTEDTPPPLDGEDHLGPPPAEPPEEIALRVRRLDGTDMEDVVVRVGESVGRRLASGTSVQSLTWVRTLRPVRFLEPVFEDDGSVVLLDGEPKTRPRTHNLATYRAACVLVDAWGSTKTISPPAAPARN